MHQRLSGRNFPAQLYSDLRSEFIDSLSSFYSGIGRDEILHALQGSIKPVDAFSIKSAIDEYQPRSILEVGSFLGFSTRWICEVSSASECTVTSLDPRLRHRVFDDLKKHVELFNVSFLNRLSFVDACLSEKNTEMFLYDYMKYEPQKTRAEALRILEDIRVVREPIGEFDLAFIDGDHSFAATQMNVSLVAQMMPKGGVILVHDAISFPDVEPALRKMSADSRCKLLGIAGPEYYQCVAHVKQPQGRAKRFIARHILNYEEQLSVCDGIAFVQVSPVP
ncbi:MAG: class I SAM-dependent methyltransferase [Pseudomonadota bacterium]